MPDVSYMCTHIYVYIYRHVSVFWASDPTRTNSPSPKGRLRALLAAAPDHQVDALV